MNINVPTLKFADNEHKTLEGKLVARGINEQILLVKIESKQSFDAPDFQLYCKEQGDYYQAGGARFRDIKNGDSAGKQMIQIYFTDEAFGGVSFSAFPLGNGEYSLRKDKAYKKEEQQQAA